MWSSLLLHVPFSLFKLFPCSLLFLFVIFFVFLVVCKVIFLFWSPMEHFTREVSWPNSNPQGNSTPTSFSTSSASDSSDSEPDFVIPRQGPRIYFDPEFTTLHRIKWQSTLVGALIDKKSIPTNRMQDIITKAWSLQGEVRVKGQVGTNYIFEFDNIQDM